MGSIEIGKDADLALFSNHPLSIYAIPQVTIVDGIVRFDIANDPSDMRLYIDPEEITPTYYGQEEVEGCMRDTIQQIRVIQLTLALKPAKKRLT